MQFTESMIYIREDFSTRWRDGQIHFTQGWHPMREISKALGYSSSMVDRSERHYGIFLWAPEFANVHVTFPWEEESFEINGEWFPHTEGYFQAMKSFGNPDHEAAKEKILKADPMDSWTIGQRHSVRKGWHTVKYDVMMQGLREKFKNPYLKDLLLSTGDYPLVQLKGCRDWGSGYEGNGKNALGVLLQNLREEIKN